MRALPSPANDDQTSYALLGLESCQQVYTAFAEQFGDHGIPLPAFDEAAGLIDRSITILARIVPANVDELTPDADDHLINKWMHNSLFSALNYELSTKKDDSLDLPTRALLFHVMANLSGNFVLQRAQAAMRSSYRLLGLESGEAVYKVFRAALRENSLAENTIRQMIDRSIGKMAEGLPTKDRPLSWENRLRVTARSLVNITENGEWRRYHADLLIHVIGEMTGDFAALQFAARTGQAVADFIDQGRLLAKAKIQASRPNSWQFRNAFARFMADYDG